MMRSTIAALIAISILSGCSSLLNTGNSDEYSCPGMPKGVVCKRPLEVYRLTNGERTQEGASVTKSADGTLYDSNRAVTNVVTGSVPPPVREPALIMRIWVAPWIDSKDDLHWPSYLFTEIQPRRWSYGTQDFQTMEQIIPHRSGAPVSGTKQQPSAPASEDSPKEPNQQMDVAPKPDDIQLN